ncbi:hypothetical protein B0H10DRAFT_1954196 [Mycena sp. CBHHK59/15]|nr:hypothetical protein B0H10DRAFT_1954196 [Mycena sp. CBHHK59/15]
MPWTSKTFSWRWDVAAAGFFLETKWSKMRQKSSEKQELRKVVGCHGTRNTIVQWKSAIPDKSVTRWLREGGAPYGKRPYLIEIAEKIDSGSRVTFDPVPPLGPTAISGTTEWRQRSFGIFSQIRMLEVPQAIAQGTFGCIATGITATLHLLHITGISGQVVLRNMIGNHGMSCHKRCPIPTEPEALALFHFASTPHFTPAYCRPEPAEFSLSSRSSQITPGPAHLTLSHRDLRTRPDPASPVNRSTCRQIRSQVIKMFLSKGSEYSGTTCLENRNRFKSSRFRGSTRFLLYQGLTYRYATLQYTVRIQSDADFPCNVRDTEWALIWGIYSAFGRVRRRIDWTNAHAPSTQYVVVLERLMSLETGLTKVVLERSGALDAGLTEQQPTVPPTCQPIALNDSLPYRQPFNTFLSTVRIQSDADFPWNGRTFGRVRRRIDWTNAHAPSTRPTIALNDSATLQYICDERLSMFGRSFNSSNLDYVQHMVVLERSGALDAGLTEQQPTVPPTCQPIALNDSLPYCQPFNTFLSTVRIQSDADFPWNGRTPSSSPTIAFNDSATPQYICNERLSTFGCELTWQQPSVPTPSTQYVIVLERLGALETGLTKLLQLVRIHLCLTVKHARNRIDLITAESQLSQVFDIPVSGSFDSPSYRAESPVILQACFKSARALSILQAIDLNHSFHCKYTCMERFNVFDRGLTNLRVYDEIGMMPLLGRTRIDLITAESQITIPHSIASLSTVRAPLDADWLGNGLMQLYRTFERVRSPIDLILTVRWGALDAGLTEQRPTHIWPWIDLIAAESQGSLVFDLPVSEHLREPDPGLTVSQLAAPSILQASDLNRSLHYTYTYIERLDAFGRGLTQYRPSPNHFHFFIVSPGCGTCVVSAHFPTV